MAIYKNKDIETNIQATHVNIGNIGAQFYTEDENSASIRIYIKHNDKPVNLETAGLTPILTLSMQDGSYFDNEPLDIVLAEQGLIQYKIRENVIKHVGKVKATLILKSETQSLHASEFSFTILSSGIDEQVAKEINIELVDDIVKNIMTDNAMGLLDDEYKEKINQDVVDYVASNPDKYKGPKGKDGSSAYQIAKEQGYKGTEQEWLDSLKLSATNQQMEDIKSQIVNSINNPTITNIPTCASRDRAVETDLRSLKDYGLQFTSFVDGYITSFDVFSSGDGVTDFYLTDYGGSGIPANIEYKRIRRKLSAGWNTIEFVHKIESNKEYCLAVSFTDAISLAIGSDGTYDDVNIQNPHLIKPRWAYRPPYGNTGTAYLFIFNIQVSIDNNSRLILNQLTNNTFEVSNTEPSNETSIWIKPQSNGG